MPDGIELDIEGSRVRLGERWFPAVVLEWPEDDCLPAMIYNPARRTDWIVNVPMENGAFVAVTNEVIDAGALYLFLHAPVWGLSGYFVINDYDEPQPMWSNGKEIVRLTSHRRGYELLWGPCDPEWAAEHIERLSRLPVQKVVGPPVVFRRLDEALDAHV